MAIPSILPSNCFGKLPADNVEVIRSFIDRGIDPHVFDILYSASFECFLLLADAGYIMKSDTIRNIFHNGYSWSFDSKLEFIDYLMNNQELNQKTNLNENILYWITDFVRDSEMDKILKIIMENYSSIKISATIAIKLYKYSDILEPAFSFSSKEFVKVYVLFEKSLMVDIWMVTKMEQYCDPADYLITEVFQNSFHLNRELCFKKFIDYGYVPKLEDYPKRIKYEHIKLFDHLKSMNLWDGETFNWYQHVYDTQALSLSTYSSRKHEFAKWMEDNGCPKIITHNSENFVNW
jgi:hypothetical protein